MWPAMLSNAPPSMSIGRPRLCAADDMKPMLLPKPVETLSALEPNFSMPWAALSISGVSLSSPVMATFKTRARTVDI